ncbi:type II 3-dehydroquinate dehydratase [Halobacillus litoralis]|uniref:type II 3-dehydroquinate dehydratase n=1 Tax=Halobacillus litoralis TaxID=45668 RepID=UPI001CD67A1E|nr:type II 3-dehydroquinate dehydratase [Halobacillus litoralis]MCA0970115.1 type II 3-dehydroquinate dehydratase [Halobacillus litoralis]
MTSKKLYLVNGPNLNLLGKREPDTYGKSRLEDVVRLVQNTAEEKGYDVIHFQSNHEGDLVDCIQKAGEEAEGIILNPAAYTHTSVAIRDAISAIAPPVIEVHISNVHRRESFRHQSFTAPVCDGQVVGFGVDGYRLATLGLIERIEEGRNKNE